MAAVPADADARLDATVPLALVADVGVGLGGVAPAAGAASTM